MASATEGRSDKALTVHAYAQCAPAQELPVTVNAPIITDGMTAEGVQPLLDFVKPIEARSNTEVAAEEARRLRPYFSALSIYLKHALKNVEPESDVAQEKETLKGLIAPRRLSDLFNAMADFTRVTFISDVVIMPDNIHKGPAASLFRGAYDPTFRYGDHPFNFGFLKIFEGGDKATARSSTTIPTFALDAKLMEEIAPHLPAELYRRFQAVVTDMNHDVLHHLHSPYINTGIAHKFDAQYYNNTVHKWASSLPENAYSTGLEQWSQISHGKVFMTPGNEALVKEVGTNLDRYFDELTRIAAALPKEKAHEVVDYFGTVMAQTLSRTFPFNHPLMTQCLERMQAADPFSEKGLVKSAIEQFAKMTGSSSSFESPAHVRRYARRYPVIAGIIEGYKQQGLDILSDDAQDISFKGLKLLQLAILEADEMRTHVPAPVGRQEQKVRTNSDRAFLNLVSVVATTTGYRPE